MYPLISSCVSPTDNWHYLHKVLKVTCRLYDCFVVQRLVMCGALWLPREYALLTDLYQRKERNEVSLQLLQLFSIVKPTRCTNVSNLSRNDTTCFGQSFRPPSGVQDSTYSNRHLSNRYRCLLASGYPLASRQQYLFGCCMYSLELLMVDGKTVWNMQSVIPK